MATTPTLYPVLQATVDTLLAETAQIPDERKIVLERLCTYVQNQLTAEAPVRLNFICTHNSRRSHIAQVWAAVAAAYYGLPAVETFSGGTEATAFNPRAVAALARAGFRIENPGGDNPHYRVSFSPEVAPFEAFSKTYDDPINPTDHLAAIMTCSDADANCPFIPGAKFRLSLTFSDPKEADDTPAEAIRYDERVQQIGRQILYAFGQITTHA